MVFFRSILQGAIFALSTLSLTTQIQAAGLIEIPSNYFPVQTTTWSCGPNSVARLLNTLGVNIKYEEVRDYAAPLLPTIKISTLNIDKVLGTPPELVSDLIKHWLQHTNVHVSKNLKNVERIANELELGNPVLALIQTGSERTILGDAPILHWVMIVGFDYDKNKILVSDPGFNRPYWEDRQSFEKRWQWNLPSNIILKTYYQNIGYSSGSLVTLSN